MSGYKEKGSIYNHNQIFSIFLLQMDRYYVWVVNKPQRSNVQYNEFRQDVLFIIGEWNAKVGSQETPEVQANLALEYRMKQGKG